jgi:hypothetical protein
MIVRYLKNTMIIIFWEMIIIIGTAVETSNLIKKTTFRKFDLLLSSVEVGETYSVGLQ